jgi:predicted MFS family arabinose efflux permease
VGPAVAGLLIAALGPGPVFLLNALTFVVPIAVLLMIGRDGSASPEPDRADRSLRAGLRYVFGRPDVVMVLVIMFFVGTFGMNFQMTMALMATEVFGQGPEEFGFLGSILAVGSLVGALLAARRRTPRRQLIVGAAVVFGLMEMLAAMSPTYWLFAVSLFPLGVTALTVITTANAYVQTFVDAEMRGRVTALYLMVFMGGTPAGAPMIGWLAEVLGPRWSMIGGGLVTAAGAVLVAVAFARRDGSTLRARLWPRAGFTVGSMS